MTRPSVASLAGLLALVGSLQACNSPAESDRTPTIGTSNTLVATSAPTTTVRELPPINRTIDGSYQAHVYPASPELLGSSWHDGCPVPVSDLRLLLVTHWDFDGLVRLGELVVHFDVASDLIEVFEKVFDAGFPIERMEPVQLYESDDLMSMAANNSSAFNCREVTGGGTWSEHAFGTAVDINPVQNPYVGASVLPAAGSDYLDRTIVRNGMVLDGDAVVEAFNAVGWSWGGKWSRPDYQHFSLTGR